MFRHMGIEDAKCRFLGCQQRLATVRSTTVMFAQGVTIHIESGKDLMQFACQRR